MTPGDSFVTPGPFSPAFRALLRAPVSFAGLSSSALANAFAHAPGAVLKWLAGVATGPSVIPVPIEVGPSTVGALSLVEQYGVDPPQTLPQAPQSFGSESTGTHAPPQSAVPSAQEYTHAPETHAATSDAAVLAQELIPEPGAQGDQ